MAFIILVLDDHTTAAAVAFIATAGTLSRAVVAYQDRYSPSDDGDHDAQDYDVPYGHSATASCSASFLFWKKGFFAISRYPNAATAMTHMMIPDTTGDSPAIRLPRT